MCKFAKEKLKPITTDKIINRTSEMDIRNFIVAVLCLLATASCRRGSSSADDILFADCCQPQAVLHDGKYYFIKQDAHSAKIELWCADELKDLPKGKHKVVWMPKDSAALKNIWSPEIHFIQNRWYIYYEADDGNTDNHHLNVLENTAADPMQGEFRHKSTLMTNPEWNWALHPSVFTVRGKLYLIWSGWPKRRAEEETQCIYIASMENPWTISSERVMISSPDLEWERQWINPDGSRSAYPIYVNENPEAFLSRDKKNIIVCYTASGNWTLFNATGMLYASVDSNLLDPKSWHKCSEPVFASNAERGVYGACDISIVPSKDGRDTYLLYESKRLKGDGYIKDIRMKRIAWDDKGFPVFGKAGEKEL